MRFLVFFISFFAFGQQYKTVDFLVANANLNFNTLEKSVNGSIEYSFKVKQSIDSIRIDAKNMSFSNVLLNNKKVNFKNNNKELILFEGYKKGKNILKFEFVAKPKQTLYFLGNQDDLQIWTQGQGKYTSHWLPSFDDVNEKLVFNISIRLNEDLNKISRTVITNGKYIKKDCQINWSEGINVNNYYFTMQKPMSSYLVMLAIGNFAKQESKSKSGTPLEFYLDKKDTDKFEPTFRYSKQMFDYLEKEIGINYPWQIYRQVAVRDFLYAGMENTTSTIFAQDFVVDSIGFNDRNYINVNAHELAHQWFGNLITAQAGKHHWLQEGFATYYALLAEKDIFGEDYFYHELYENAIELQRAAKTDTIPVMNEKASSLSFYKKGAWALHILREDIGAKKFNEAVRKYLKKYQYKNVETDDFLSIVNKISGYNVAEFKKKWLETAGFDMELATIYLEKNVYLKKYLLVKKSKSSLSEIKDILNSDAYVGLKEMALYKILNSSFKDKKEILESAFASNDVILRRTIAKTLKVIPLEFKANYEQLLLDESYITKELALLNLCENFPSEKMKYLEITKNWIGLNDKSFRISWLALALKSEYANEEIENFKKELIDYTTINYEASIRQNAFEVLLNLEPENEVVLQNLFLLTTHHKWQYSKFARENVREIIKNKRSFIEQLSLKQEENIKSIMVKFLNE